jgi:hypothetical protein
MLAPSALIRGLVARALPSANADSPNVDVGSRFGRYGESAVLSVVRKQHLLADEGSYFITNNNAQSGILGSPATGFVATTPIMTVFNTDLATNPNAKRIYLDGLWLMTTVVGSAASALVNLQGALYLDTGSRYTSGGAVLTNNIVNPNMDSAAKSIAQVQFGAITAPAATAAARAISPFRIIRPAVSGTVLDVIGEVKWFNFGGVEGMLSGSMVAANANFIPIPMPPVILGPQQSAILYLWQNVGATNVAATYAPELSWWER